MFLATETLRLAVENACGRYGGHAHAVADKQDDIAGRRLVFSLLRLARRQHDSE